MTFRSRRWFLLLCAVTVPLAALAVDTSAQRPPTPERSLSDAIAEVLGGPFHGDHAPLGLGSQDLLLSAVSQPSAAHGRATSRTTGLPNGGFPLAGDELPPNRPVGPAAFGAMASHIVTVAFLRCQSEPYVDRGTFTGPVLPGFPTAEGESLCRFFDAGSESVGKGFLLLVPPLTTAGAATLGGSGFLRAVGGSALGFLGSVLFYRGMKKVLDKSSIHDVPIPIWAAGGLIHGIATAYLSG